MIHTQQQQQQQVNSATVYSIYCIMIIFALGHKYQKQKMKKYIASAAHRNSVRSSNYDAEAEESLFAQSEP